MWSGACRSLLPFFFFTTSGRAGATLYGRFCDPFGLGCDPFCFVKSRARASLNDESLRGGLAASTLAGAVASKEALYLKPVQVSDNGAAIKFAILGQHGDGRPHNRLLRAGVLTQFDGHPVLHGRDSGAAQAAAERAWAEVGHAGPTSASMRR